MSLGRCGEVSRTLRAMISRVRQRWDFHKLCLFIPHPTPSGRTTGPSGTSTNHANAFNCLDAVAVAERIYGCGFVAGCRSNHGFDAMIAFVVSSHRFLFLCCLFPSFFVLAFFPLRSYTRSSPFRFSFRGNFLHREGRQSGR